MIGLDNKAVRMDARFDQNVKILIICPAFVEIYNMNEMKSDSKKQSK